MLISPEYMLPRSFYQRPAKTLARALLGKLLVRQEGPVQRIGRIVEVEAYLGPQDLAAHSSKGRTARTEVMFGPAGHAYVYLIYGIHHCMNVVAGGQGEGSAVLLRALEPVANLEGRSQGPGLLCKAMGIDLSHYGWDLCSDDLFIAEARALHLRFPRQSIVARPRIGVDYAGAWAAKPLRFYLEGNPFISRK
jgi:DNA-3-methyladenine glycosylase